MNIIISIISNSRIIISSNSNRNRNRTRTRNRNSNRNSNRTRNGKPFQHEKRCFSFPAVEACLALRALPPTQSKKRTAKAVRSIVIYLLFLLLHFSVQRSYSTCETADTV